MFLPDKLVPIEDVRASFGVTASFLDSGLFGLRTIAYMCVCMCVCAKQ